MGTTAATSARHPRRARQDEATAGLTVTARAARGKAARAAVPREKHADFEPAPGRPDPVGLLQDQSATRPAACCSSSVTGSARPAAGSKAAWASLGTLVRAALPRAARAAGLRAAWRSAGSWGSFGTWLPANSSCFPR